MSLDKPIKEIYDELGDNEYCDKKKARKLQLLGRGLIIEGEKTDFDATINLVESEYNNKANVIEGRWDEAPPPPPKLPDCCLL